MAPAAVKVGGPAGGWGGGAKRGLKAKVTLDSDDSDDKPIQPKRVLKAKRTSVSDDSDKPIKPKRVGRANVTSDSDDSDKPIKPKRVGRANVTSDSDDSDDWMLHRGWNQKRGAGRQRGGWRR